MDWKTMLGYVSGSVDEKLLLRNGYLVAENRVLRNQIQGRLRLTDAKRPGATVLSPFVFLDTTGWRSRIRSGGIHAFAAPVRTFKRRSCSNAVQGCPGYRRGFSTHPTPSGRNRHAC